MPEGQDAYDFLNSTGLHASPPSGITTTGVDDIDLWMGGLAEKQMVFGGLLGPTFNYVFENQMENLQDGDRFYYLSRTAGLNMLTQLEGNSFSELIMRNTDVEALPADSFSRPAFHLRHQGTERERTDHRRPGDRVDERQSSSACRTARSATADPSTSCSTAGTPRTTRRTTGSGRVRATTRCAATAATIASKAATASTNSSAVSATTSSPTCSVTTRSRAATATTTCRRARASAATSTRVAVGDDFIVGGNDMTETFAGEGNDFVFAGDAEDTVFGDGGDDWIEGGLGPFNLLQGDNGAPFQDDPNEPGHDVLDSDGGERTSTPKVATTSCSSVAVSSGRRACSASTG